MTLLKLKKSKEKKYFIKEILGYEGVKKLFTETIYFRDMIKKLQKNKFLRLVKAKTVSRLMGHSKETKKKMICEAAKNLLKHSDEILNANNKDIKENGKKLNASTLDRLVLDKLRVESISNYLMVISKLDDPVGKIIDSWTRPNGLEIQKYQFH